jgi:hypothetical protein
LDSIAVSQREHFRARAARGLLKTLIVPAAAGYGV